MNKKLRPDVLQNAEKSKDKRVIETPKSDVKNPPSVPSSR